MTIQIKSVRFFSIRLYTYILYYNTTSEKNNTTNSDEAGDVENIFIIIIKDESNQTKYFFERYK